MRSLLFAALLAAGSAHAALMATNGRDTIRLYTKACDVPEIIEKVAPEDREGVMAATAVVGGKIFRACWIGTETVVIVAYEDDDFAFLPRKAFREDGHEPAAAR